LALGPVVATQKMRAEPTGAWEQGSVYLRVLTEVGAINRFACSIELQKADGTSPHDTLTAELNPAQ
jgi:hypothetical protein